MGKITIACLAVSTVILLIAFGQGVGLLRGGDVASHLGWAMAALVSVLAANVLAMFHAAQSDRIIRDLRSQIERADPCQPPP